MKERKIKKENMGIKNYIKNFLIFIRDNVEKKFGILLAISLLLIAIELKIILGLEQGADEVEKIGLFKEYWENVKIIFITGFAGIVPYMYAPVVGYFGYIYIEVAKLVSIIKTYGYLKGILLGGFPFLLNIVVICIVTALGIYICRKITVGYKISNVKNMNFLNFRIRLYEVIGNETKEKELAKKRDDKIAKLENSKEKLNYLQIVNTMVVCLILEFISVVLGRILM